MQTTKKRKKPSPKASNRARRTLRGVVVVIDPGHGGADPGAGRDGIWESALSYRMAATLAAVVRGLGAEVRFTVRSAALRRVTEGHREPPLPLPRDAKSIDGHPMRAGREDPEELYRRAEVAAKAWRQERPHVVFLALHFDVDANPAATGGFPIYDTRAGAQPNRLVVVISERFRKAGLAGTRGGQPHPRELGVLNPERNPVPQKTLVELAVLTNASERRRVQTAAWRWRTARILAASLVQCHKEKRI